MIGIIKKPTFGDTPIVVPHSIPSHLTPRTRRPPALAHRQSLSIFLLAFSAGVTTAGGVRGADPFADEVAPFLARFCCDCHQGDAAEGGVDLSQPVTLDEARSRRASWNQVRGLIQIGAMPPEDHDPLPSPEERQAIAERIDQLINRVDCGANPGPGRVTMRRLNVVEYDNTVRDLMRLDFKPSEVVGLPSDDVGNGFDNQGEVLAMSPLLMEKYLAAAVEIADRAIVVDREPLREQFAPGGVLAPEEQLEREFWLADGEYELFAEARLESGGDDQRVEVELHFDGRVVGTGMLGRSGGQISTRLPARAGRRLVGVRLAINPADHQPGRPTPRVKIEHVGIRGPKYGLPALPPSHAGLIIAYPSGGKTVREAATRVFQAFLPRVYRRAVEPQEVARLAELVVGAVESGLRYEQGVALGVQAALVSPHFLFRVESPPESDQPTPVSGHELASRLSYFLGATMPDDELLKLADRDRLQRDRVLRQQVRRLLAEPNADTLVTRFFAQWLGLTRLEELSPDPTRFPQWNKRLAAAAREETFRLCRALLAEDGGLMDLFDADFTYINPRLAELYGVGFEGRDPRELYFSGPGIESNRGDQDNPERNAPYQLEDQWVRAPVAAGRRGVMTHASVLALTSNPSATSPVKRGRWVLDVVLGDSPPPAPPSVPSLEQTAAGAEDKPLREQLALHRANASCAACHKLMDPIGLGLENFDAIGRWRDVERGHKIDSSGVLAGRRFAGPIELLEIIREREEDIAENFVSRLLTYALGRGLRPADQCAVDEIVAAAKPNRYRLSELITGVVMSEPFRMHSF